MRKVDGSLEVHRYGFRQPAETSGEVSALEVGVALVPGLAFDRWGGRLGHGKGHYDRLLSRLGARAELVGVTAEQLVRPAPLPTEPHDVAVAWLATDRGVRRVLGPPAG